MTFASLIDTLASSAILVHLGALMQAAGFLVRDQLLLRLLVFAGTVFYGLYYYFGAPTPLWQALGWSLVLGATNLSMIVRLLIERTTLRMSADEKRLYIVFSSMSPGEFRRLLRVCDWQQTEVATVLTRENEPNERLYYVVEGRSEVGKGSSRFKLKEGSFVGELSYLLKTAATATVSVSAGALVASWRHADLVEIERKFPSIRIAMREILNVDLASKVKEGMRV